MSSLLALQTGLPRQIRRLALAGVTSALMAFAGAAHAETTVTLAQGCGPGTPQRVIRVDAVSDPLFRRRLCAPIELFVTPRFITQIRVQHDLGEFTCSPDEFGDLKLFVNNALAVDSVLRVRPTAAGLTIELVGEAATG